jgi:hypothetical protein
MKPSSKIQTKAFVATLLFLGALSGAQEQRANDWGNTVHGLQMRIYLDQAATGQSKVPSFKVELRNVGEKDLLFNLGTMTRNGAQYDPNSYALAGRSFDKVNPERDLGPPPMSNTLQFEVPIR